MRICIYILSRPVSRRRPRSRRRRRTRSRSTPMRASPPNGARARRSKKAFEAECGCDARTSSRSPTASLCSTASSSRAQSTKADIVLGLDTNLTAEAKADRPVRAAWRRSAPPSTFPGGWTRRRFSCRSTTAISPSSTTPRSCKNPPEQPEGAGRGRSRREDRHRGSAHLDARARPAALGEGGLRRSGGRRLGQAEAARAHRHARLERGLWPVHQGRGADGAVLHHLAGLPHDRRGQPTATRPRPSPRATTCRSKWPGITTAGANNPLAAAIPRAS